MKKIVIASGLLMAGNAIFSQSAQEGNTYLYYERHASAENTFNQLTKAGPSNAEAWLGLTKTYMLTQGFGGKGGPGNRPGFGAGATAV